MEDDFFASEEEEEEFENIEENELVSRYENMLKNNQPAYFSEDDYEVLFLYYSLFYDELIYAQFLELTKLASVIHAGIRQYPHACQLQMFYIYYRYLHKELSQKEALKQLELLELPNYERSRYYNYLIDIYVRMDAKEKAIALCNELLQAAQTNENRMGVYSKLIFMCDEPEEVPQMISYCEKYCAIVPAEEDKLLEALWEHFEESPSIKSTGILFFTSYLEQHPFSEKGWVCLGLLHQSDEIYEDAVEAFQNAVALSSKTTPLLLLATAYRRWGKNEKALECYTEVMTLEPVRTDFYVYMAEAYRETRQAEKALYYYGLVLDAKPTNLRALIGTGVVLAETARYEEALPYLEKVRQGNGNFGADALLLMGDCMLALEKDEQAIAIYKQVMDECPNMSEVWLSYSNYYTLTDDYKQAIDTLNQGIAIFPEDAVLLYRMANYLFLYGDHDYGATMLKIACNLDPDSLYRFLEYNEQTAQLPEVIEIINELNDKE
jgi:tetratricopeptide (TPR) repeat protein